MKTYKFYFKTPDNLIWYKKIKEFNETSANRNFFFWISNWKAKPLEEGDDRGSATEFNHNEKYKQ